LLADYALYWAAETDLAQHQDAAALAELKQVRQNYPDSVITDQVLQSMGTAAMALDQPAEAVSALDAYPMTAQRPGLLLLRGEAHEKAGQALDAATDYQTLYTRFALSEQAREAATRMEFLRSAAGQVPPIPLDQRLNHADIVFNAKSWGVARSEYAALLPQLSGADTERAELRILECGVALGASPSQVIALKLTDPDVDAERSYTLADYYRSHQLETDMAAAVENAASRVKPVGCCRPVPRGKLLLGAPRPRPGRGLLQAACGAISLVSGCRECAVAGSMDGCAQTRAGRGRTAAGASSAVSRISLHARCALLARPACGRGRSCRSGAQLLRQAD
jgi:hypothetical protein